MDQGAPPRKTQSFKEETKSQNWFQRQFSRQMSRDDHPSNIIERTAAVAAAALAINRLEEIGIPDQKELREHPETSSITSKSEEEDKPSLAHEFGSVSKRFPGNENGSGKGAKSFDEKEVKAWTEVEGNKRTLAMVLTSERELLCLNKEQEIEIAESKLMLQNNSEVSGSFCYSVHFDGGPSADGGNGVLGHC